MEDHYFFIDESGSKTWETPYRREFVESPPSRDSSNIDFWRKNYLVLAGIHISSKTIVELNPILNDLKKHCFGTNYIEIKSD